MLTEDFDEWFDEVKLLVEAPRLRPADAWRDGDTWHDAFLDCLTPSEAVVGVTIRDTEDRPLLDCPKLQGLVRRGKRIGGLIRRSGGYRMQPPAVQQDASW